MNQTHRAPHSSRAALWTAVRDQATKWAETDVVGVFVSALPRSARPGASELDDALQRLKAGASTMFANPFRLPSRLAMAVSVAPGIDLDILQANHPRWFEAATRVERAHRATVDWLRSRLPGYPMLPAPHLAPNTPFTTFEYTDEMIWTRGELAGNLHMNDPAPGVTALLGVDGLQAAAIDQVARDLAVALERSPEWERLELAGINLDPEGRRALSQARTNLRSRLSPQSVDGYEPTLALRRNQYRATVLGEAMNALTGSAAEYASAFDAANRILDYAASDVMSRLASYPMSNYASSTIEVLEPGTPMVIEFFDESPLTWLAWPGEIGWVNDDLVEDAVEVTGMRMNFSMTGEGSVRLTARTLPGTGEAWRRATQSSPEATW
jgi:hypothetical protein